MLSSMPMWINLKVCSSFCFQRFHIKPLVLSPKELKSIKNKPVEFKGMEWT